MSLRQLSAAAAFAVFGIAAVVLLLSDRAGGLLDDVVQVITRAGRRAERESGVDFIDRADVPGEADEIAHALFWGTGMLVIGWVTRARVPLMLTAMLLAGVSLAIELAQPALSATRAIESSDVAANMVGLAIGAVALAVLKVALGRWSAADAEAS